MPRLLVPRTPTHTSATIPTHTQPRRCSPCRPCRPHPRTRNNRRRRRRRNRGKNLPINTFTLPHRTSTPTTFKSTSFISFWSGHAGDVVALESAGLAAGVGVRIVRVAVLEDREGGRVRIDGIFEGGGKGTEKGWDGTYKNFSRRENCESEGWEEREEGEGVDEEEDG